MFAQSHLLIRYACLHDTEGMTRKLVEHMRLFTETEKNSSTRKEEMLRGNLVRVHVHEHVKET